MTEFHKSPMMLRYHAIKSQYPEHLLFYRMGDFYELFFEDAEIAAKALGIVLHKRGKHEGRDIPMCGVPIERADDYCNRLIAQGHGVAWCDRHEDSDSRIVWRLTTPSFEQVTPVPPEEIVEVERIRAEIAEANAFTEKVLGRLAKFEKAHPEQGIVKSGDNFTTWPTSVLDGI